MRAPKEQARMSIAVSFSLWVLLFLLLLGRMDGLLYVVFSVSLDRQFVLIHRQPTFIPQVLHLVSIMQALMRDGFSVICGEAGGAFASSPADE